MTARTRMAPAGALAVLAAVCVSACGGGAAAGSGGVGRGGAAARVGAAVQWRKVTLSGGGATLSYPPGWSVGTSDPGTASAYLGLSPADIPRGYLNLTPRQGGETLSNWTRFRIAHNREEGDRGVRVVGPARHVALSGGAVANCVEDVYRARVGARHWHELACFVQGRGDASVFIGAAQPGDWPALAPAIRRSLSALVQR